MESSSTLVKNLIIYIQRFANEGSLGSYLGLMKAARNILFGVASKAMVLALAI